jgi:hypothetical protein
MGFPGGLGSLANPDSALMRKIIGGMRQNARPDRIHEALDGTLYGQGDPTSIAIAEEARNTERARGDRRLSQSAMTFVDPRLERDNPRAAGLQRIEGERQASAIPDIEDGPLAQLLNKGTLGVKMLPAYRGAKRTEDIADANAEAANYRSAPQQSMRDLKREEGVLDAQAGANAFMDPRVTQARGIQRKEKTTDALAEATDPTAQGFKALQVFLNGLGGGQYPPDLSEIANMFKLPGVTPPASRSGDVGSPVPGTTMPVGADGAATGGKVMSRQQAIREAQEDGFDPEEYMDMLRQDGFTIR